MDEEFQAIDDLDRRILVEMQDNGRISWRELGDRVHLAATSVAERVRRLEQVGVIKSYRAVVDSAAVGRSVRAVVDVSLSPGDVADSFEIRLADREEVVFAAYVTGSADYTVVVECEGADGLDAFVRWVRADEAVSRTESKLILRSIIN
jgi:Lrp/AsnC family leucine-responsive transcriptional regulator